MNIHKSIFSLTLILVSVAVYAQDLIVPVEGDSINCYITSVKRDSIYYKYWEQEDIKDKVLGLNQVKRFEYYFYDEFNAIVEENIDSAKVKFVIGLGTGLSFRLGKLDPAISKENEADYRNGFNFAANVGVLISKNFGVGLKYNQHNTKSGIKGFQSTVKISYLGPYLSLQTKPINNIMTFSGLFGVGKLNYKENIIESISYISNEYEFKDSTIGMNIGESYNLLLSPNLNFSLNINVISGKIEDGELVDKNGNRTSLPDENASTFNFGFSFNLLL